MKTLLSRLRNPRSIARLWAYLNHCWDHLIEVSRDSWIHHHDIPVFLHDQPDWHIPRGPP